jgi:hypothetical protein
MALEGYPKLSRLMASYPEAAIFRRFGALNAEKLLYLQAELQDLEIALRKQQKEDLASNRRDRILYSRDWWTLKESGAAEAEEGNDGRQWELVLKIRKKLKEYGESTCRILRNGE